MPHASRRDFVKQACCAAVGSTGIFSALTQLRVLGAVAADALPSTAAATAPDFKALVCLFLFGGNDGTNVVIPSDDASYAIYAKARAELAVAQSSLLPITPRKYSDGRRFALHPSVPGMQSLFNEGKLAVLGNVGTLARPMTLADYTAGRFAPPQLFSHPDQTLQWQSSIADKPFETGWGGRLADIMDALNANNQIAMSISLNGTNSFQRGKNVGQFTINPGGTTSIAVPPALNFPGFAGLRSLMAIPNANVHAATFGGITRQAIDDSTLVSSVLKTAPTLRTVFPGTQTGTRLAMIARLISVAADLGLKRQIFFVQLGGFDLHGAQAQSHGPLLAELSAALRSFSDATTELGVANQVTTFTASDFGRSYVPNAGGTDHGWGNHQFIMGGAVQGGDIYGQMPSLAINGPDDTGRGRWLPSTSVDEYNATLATWFGVSAGNLSTVLPNIGRFAKPNLGFMG